MRYYIIAGEASGDLHASNLIKGLKKEDAEAEVRGWGGDFMRDAGAEIVRHYKDTAVMGFITVLKNLDKIIELEPHAVNAKALKKLILTKYLKN